jgi:hypothetical protein
VPLARSMSYLRDSRMQGTELFLNMNDWITIEAKTPNLPLPFKFYTNKSLRNSPDYISFPDILCPFSTWVAQDVLNRNCFKSVNREFPNLSNLGIYPLCLFFFHFLLTSDIFRTQFEKWWSRNMGKKISLKVKISLLQLPK